MLDRNKLLEEWRKIENGFKFNRCDIKNKVLGIPNMVELFEKIKKGEIKI